MQRICGNIAVFLRIMTFDLLAALAAFAFVASVTPGPNNLMLMASGANFGVIRTLPHMLGVNLGFTAMIALIGLGLARLFEAFPVLYVIMKTVSVLYLLYLAWKIANAAPPAKDAPQAAGKPLTFLQAAAFQWVNPKAWAMALTAIAAYAQAGNAVISILIIALVFGVVNLPSISLWTIAGAQLRRFLSSPARLRAFNVIAGLLLAATIAPIVMGHAA